MTESKKIITRSLDEISLRGEDIYAKVKDQYEPQYQGKILAIDIETGKVYMADTVRDAVALAEAEHPDSQCYILRVGFDSVYAGVH